MKKLQTLLLASAAAVVVTAAASSASANLITHQIDGNDCSGFFGTGFEACTIFAFNDEGEKVELSPVIAKYDFAGEDEAEKFDDVEVGDLIKTETNSLYPSIDGSEFSWSDATQTSGTWAYEPGTDDPGVRYWVAKGGNFFLLNWVVDNDAVASGGACENPSFFNLDCLEEALVVTSGAWSTPVMPAPGGPPGPAEGTVFGLSHLTFYDTAVPPTDVPEPATLGLLGIGLLGAGYMARRRRLEA